MESGPGKAGWYEDPEQPGRRYWDGTAWGDRWDDEGYVAPEKQKLPENDGWANVGYILAVLLPVIGLLIGSTLSRRGDSRGPTIMIISAVVIAIALVVAALSVA